MNHLKQTLFAQRLEFAPYTPLDAALSVANAYVEKVRAAELERRTNMKDAHEGAFKAKLAAYDESLGKGGKGKSPATPVPEFEELPADDDVARGLAYEEEQFLGSTSSRAKALVK